MQLPSMCLNKLAVVLTVLVRAAQTYSEKWNTVLLETSMFHLEHCRLQLQKLSRFACSWFVVPVPTELFCEPEHWTLLLSEAPVQPQPPVCWIWAALERSEEPEWVFLHFVEEEESQHTVHNPSHTSSLPGVLPATQGNKSNLFRAGLPAATVCTRDSRADWPQITPDNGYGLWGYISLHPC